MAGECERKNVIQNNIAQMYEDDGDAFKLASAFLSNSVSFFEQMIYSSMDEFHQELKMVSGAKEEEVWNLVITAVSKIFKWLRIVRRSTSSVKNC